MGAIHSLILKGPTMDNPTNVRAQTPANSRPGWLRKRAGWLAAGLLVVIAGAVLRVPFVENMLEANDRMK